MKSNCIGNYNINTYEYVCLRGCREFCELDEDVMFEETFTGDVFEVDGETVISFPDELIERLDWQEGDNIEFLVEDDKITLVNLSLQLRNPT